MSRLSMYLLSKMNKIPNGEHCKYKLIQKSNVIITHMKCTCQGLEIVRHFKKLLSVINTTYRSEMYEEQK